MHTKIPRITISALRGGSGKTIVSIGLIASLKGRGYEISPFKKGPDFIDSFWLKIAAKRECYNLDPFLMDSSQLLDSFLTHSMRSDIAIIEGNRGIYDGMDLNGTCSTAELAKLIRSPVILILDATMSTRTNAALVLGCEKLDPSLNLRGVILNRLGGLRQERVIKESIKRYCDAEVVGAIPRYHNNPFPQRHMGLVPFHESSFAIEAIGWAKEMVERYVYIERILEISRDTHPLEIPISKTEDRASFGNLSVGFIRDRAFWFYYPENLEQLRQLGADLVEIDSTKTKELPEIDALYIGGGFPELHLEYLSENIIFKRSIRDKIEAGLPVYAECGGFMYLGNFIIAKERKFPMVGAFPISFFMESRPQGHGYTVLDVIKENPYYEVGSRIKGHEFHYSRPIIDGSVELVFNVRRGKGIDRGMDGAIKKNTLATYSHIHCGGERKWAKAFLALAHRYRKNLKKI